MCSAFAGHGAERVGYPDLPPAARVSRSKFIKDARGGSEGGPSSVFSSLFSNSCPFLLPSYSVSSCNWAGGASKQDKAKLHVFLLKEGCQERAFPKRRQLLFCTTRIIHLKNFSFGDSILSLGHADLSLFALLEQKYLCAVSVQMAEAGCSYSQVSHPKIFLTSESGCPATTSGNRDYMFRVGGKLQLRFYDTH